MKLNLPVSLNIGMDWITATTESRNKNLLEANDMQSHLMPESSNPSKFQFWAS